MKFREVVQLPQFKKDLKQLVRKYRTLAEDLEVFIFTALVLCHKLKVSCQGIYPISGVGFSEPSTFIAKDFACRSLRGKGVKSGIRVVYAYFEKEDRIELIEIYHKNQKEIEDKDRIKQIYGSEQKGGT